LGKIEKEEKGKHVWNLDVKWKNTKMGPYDMK